MDKDSTIHGGGSNKMIATLDNGGYCTTMLMDMLQKY